MRKLFVHIILLGAVLWGGDGVCNARGDAPVAAVVDTMSCARAFAVPMLDPETVRRMMCRTPGSVLRSLVGRDLGHDYRVCIMAGSAWRPFRDFGDTDNKVRVHSPTVGVSLRYSFSM